MKLSCLRVSQVKSSLIFALVLLIQVCLAKESTSDVTGVYQNEDRTTSPVVTSTPEDTNEQPPPLRDYALIIRTNYSNLQKINEITTISDTKHIESTTPVELVDDIAAGIAKLDRPISRKNGAKPVEEVEELAQLPEGTDNVNISESHLNVSHKQQDPKLSLINPEINEIVEANQSEHFGEIRNIESSFKQRIGFAEEEPNSAPNLSKPRENEKNIFAQPAMTTTIPQVLNLAELSDEYLDSWSPVWPFPKLDAVPIKPTVRFPSITGRFTKIEPTPLFGGGYSDNFSIEKEPVTAYYFDLSSAIPSQPAGPLYDSVNFVNNETVNSRPDTKVKVTDVDPSVNHSDLSLESSFDDYIQNSNLKLPDPIVSTPTMDQSNIVFKDDTDLYNNVTFSAPVIAPATSVPGNKLHSLVDKSAYKNISSVEYTLGNASDFQFDKVASVSTEHYNLVNSSLQSNSNLSSDVPHANTEKISGDTLNSLIKSAFNASLKSTDRETNSASMMDVNKDHQDIPSDALSRIPLWQRISQKTSTTLVPPVAFASTLSSALNNFLPNLSSSTTFNSKYPFENDIPIGILSPGIFKSNGRFPDTSLLDEGTNRKKEHFTESETVADDQNLKTPFLESSFQSNTQSTSVASPTALNNNDMTTVSVGSLGTHISELTTPFLDNSILSNIFPTSLAKLPKDSELGSTRSVDETPSVLVEKHILTQPEFTVQSKPLLTISSTSSKPVISDKNTKDFMLEVTIKPTSVNTKKNSADFNRSEDPDFPKERNLEKPRTSSNESPSFVNNFEHSATGNSVNMTAGVPNTPKTTAEPSYLPEEDDRKTTAFDNEDVIDSNQDSGSPILQEGGEVGQNESHLDKNDSRKDNEDVAGPSVDLINKNDSLTTTTSIPSTTTTTSTTTTSSTISSSSTTTNPATTKDVSSHTLKGEHRPTTEKVLLVPLTSKAPLDATVTQPPFITEGLPGVIRHGANSSNSSANQEEKVIVVVGKDDEEPQLHLIRVNQDGTNTTLPSPYVKAAVSYDIKQFCKHERNIYALLVEWINKHLTNMSDERPYEIEVFNQPECKNIYLLDNDTRLNRTYVYFYVKEDGQISPNLTLQYPKNPTELEISKDLDYLKRKILHLELVNAAPSQEDLLIEEAAVGTTIVVAVIVTSLLIILLVASVFVLIVIRRKRAADNIHGRRCTPAANDAYSLDSVSVFYHSIRRKSRKRASNKSLKSYLNQGFDDPNGPSRPLNFVKLTHCISDMEGIYDEFSNIPAITPKYDEMPRGVEDKNRYANVIPVSETRILLNKTSPKDEYINANSVHGPKGELRYYIATQGPLDETVADFWQMVWEQESKVIVMLTDFVEKGIDKCADYLPPSETLDCHRVYGEFQITLKSRDLREKYIVSVVQIKNLENNLVREIAHMWFNGWPHSGVPNEEKFFISFIFDIRTTRKQLRAKGPIIVHCSPGTGRTGTFIACDLVMKQFDENKVVDIPKTVYRIRRERAGAVQTKEQYAFIYRVVNLYAAKLTTGNLDSF